MQLLISLDMWTRKRLHAQWGCTINRVRRKRTGDEEHHHLVAIIVYLWGIEDNVIKRPPLFEPSAKANSLWTMTCLHVLRLTNARIGCRREWRAVAGRDWSQRLRPKRRLWFSFKRRQRYVSVPWVNLCLSVCALVNACFGPHRWSFESVSP